MKKILLKRILITVSLAIFICVGILAVHIYSVTHKQQTPLASKQLSRIDFLQPIDSLQGLSIRYQVAAMPGIESTYFNHAQNILVYTYSPEKQTSTAVFDALISSGHYKAKRYIVSQTEITNGCPAGFGKQTLSGKATAYITGLFN